MTANTHTDQKVMANAQTGEWEVVNPDGPCLPLSAFYNLQAVKLMGLKNEKTPQEIFDTLKTKIPDLEMMSPTDYMKNVQHVDVISPEDKIYENDWIVIASKTVEFSIILVKKSMCDKFRGNE